MEKIKNCFILLITLTIGFIIGTNKVNAATATIEHTGFFYDRYYGTGTLRSSDKFVNYYIDGTTSYCIEPMVPAGTNNYLQGNWADTGLPEGKKNRVTEIAYFGYTYPGHNTEKFRMATQAMIWEAISEPGAWVKVSTELWGKGTLLDLSQEREAIEQEIAKSKLMPSFDGKVISASVGEEVTLTDTNEVISNYDITVTNRFFLLIEIRRKLRGCHFHLLMLHFHLRFLG